MTVPLEKMLRADTGKEQIAAALALVPLGKAATALPILRDAVQASPDLVGTAETVLPWLVWEQRLKTFQDLCLMTAGKEERSQLIVVFSSVPDRRAAEPMWALLADAQVSDGEAGARTKSVDGSPPRSALLFLLGGFGSRSA